MDLKDEFYNHCLYDLEHSPRTAKMYVRRLGYAERIFGLPVHDIQDWHLDNLKRLCIAGELELGRESVKGIMVAVRQFHMWGAAKGKWKLNGISLVRTIKVPRSLANPLSIDEVRELKAACRKPLEFRLIHGISYTGMRIGEIAPIEGSWWRSGWLRFTSEKSDRIREVPVHPELDKVMWRVLAHPPSYDSTLQRVKRRLEQRTGIRFTAHQLRDTFATCLQDAGVSWLCRRELLGHALGLDGVYAMVSRREKEEAILRLPY